MSVQHLYVARRNNKGSKFIYGIKNATDLSHILSPKPRVFPNKVLADNNERISSRHKQGQIPNISAVYNV